MSSVVSRHPVTSGGATTLATPAGERLLPEAWEQEGGEHVVLLATRCERCHALTFPPTIACPQCWERLALRREALPPSGVLSAHTVVHVPSQGIPAPYAIGYVDFPDLGLRLCGRLAEWSDIVDGDHVEAIAGVLSERAQGPLLGWMFRKAPP